MGTFTDMPALGEVVSGRYRLEAVIGKGGMGTVFKAEHVNMGKTFALKMLAMHRADDEAFRRFRLEAKLASQLNHPNIVAITDFDVDNNRPFIVMDYLRGRSLERVLRDLPILPNERFVNIMAQACRGLGYAHKNGLVHRDVKLSNLMLVERGGEKDVLIIVDFGLVDVMNTEVRAGATSSTTVGSPHFMAPEQCLGKKVDERADIYSLGIVMYRCLSGVVPFRGDSAREVFTKQVYEPPLTFNDINPQLQVPPALERIVMKALEKNPDDRYQDMQTMHDDLVAALKRRKLIDQVNTEGLSKDKSLLNKDHIREFKGEHNALQMIVMVVAAVAVVFVSLYAIGSHFVKNPDAPGAVPQSSVH